MKMMLASFLLSGTVQAQQNNVEVPGDHFSLEGALELFKKSSSPEDFERQLNSRNSEVNNLDLNGDGNTDYIRVIDRNEGNVHAFILQAIISPSESQDVAVIELEKLANGKAVLQITGDADIYGIETIIEPTEEVRVNAGTSTARTYVNVWAWPSVRYVYSPYYYGWVSPWGWDYWPGWWSPWRPVTYVTYYSRWEPYRYYYAPCYTHRVVYARDIYRPYRTTSVTVYNRHSTQITSYRSTRNDYHNRGRDYDRHDDNGYDRSRDQRGRPVVTDRTNNSNNSSRDWGRSHNEDHSKSSNNSGKSWENRSGKDAPSVPSTWKSNANGLHSREFKNKSTFEKKERGSGNSNRPTFESNDRSSQDQNRSAFESREHSSQERNRSTFENRSTTNLNREPVRKQQFEGRNNSSHQREFRSSEDNRGSQHSIQPNQHRSTGNNMIQRSGNGSENKSSGQKRGRDK